MAEPEPPPQPIDSRQVQRARIRDLEQQLERQAAIANEARAKLQAAVELLRARDRDIARLSGVAKMMHGDISQFIRAVWPHLDRKGAELAVTLWRKAQGPQAPLPGPLPGSAPELLLVEHGRAVRA